MSKFEKVIAGFVGFATAVTMSFGTASAATTEELQAQIASLLATIQGLQSQLGTATTGTATTAGYTFAKDLTVGSKGADVTNLQNVVGVTPATGYFGAITKAAVIKYQIAKGITPAAGYVGAKTRAFLNTGVAGTTTTTTPVVVGTGTTLAAAISFDTPAAGTIIAGQAVADLAHFTFSNPTGVEQKVTKLVLNRTGISNDSTLSNVYLFEGAKRLTDSATVSVTKVTFNDASGLFTIPAGGMKTIAVKADIHIGTAGQVIGVSLATAEGSVAVSGAYPILGNNQSIATATMADVNFSLTVTPAPATIDPQNEYVMWQNTVSFTTRAVNLKSMIFRQIGSVGTADIGNFKLFVDGTQVGSTVAALDSNGYITFDLTAAPKTIDTGSHTIKLVGDIIGGSTKTFSFSIQNAGDAVFVDSQVGQPVLVRAGSTFFTALTTGTETVNGGSLTITKKADSPSGNVTKTASNALLGRFEVKAAGESIKIENLKLNIAQTGGTASHFSLRNGTIFADGVQVGNTTSIAADNTSSTFNFGSSLVVVPGKTVLLEVRADIYNDSSAAVDADTIVAGDTITANIIASTSNLKKMSSLTYTSNTAVSANTLTVAVGALTGAKNSAYANQTVITPQTAIKLAAFTVTSNETEKVNLDTISLAFTGVNAGVATGLTDVYVKYGSKTSSIKSTVASTTSWSVSEEMASNTSMVVEVYGSMTSSLVNTNTLITSLTMSGTTASSASAVSTNSIDGQTITVSTGSVAAAAVSDSTLATKMVIGNTSPKVASFRFTAVNDTYKVTDMALLAAGGANGAGAIRTLTLKSAGMADKEVWLGAGYEATSSNLAIIVPANDSAGVIVDVYANLNAVGGYAATSSADVSVTLDTFKTVNSVGTVGTTATDVTTNAQYVFKSVPTITLQTLPSTLLQAGTKTLSKFTVSADSAGAIGWKGVAWTISKSAATTITGTTAATSTLKLYNAAGDVIDGLFATTTVSAGQNSLTSLFADQSTGGTLFFVATNEQQITTSETYSLKGTVGGTMNGTQYYISTSIANPNTSHSVPSTFVGVAGALGAGAGDPSFVWTDRSENSHSESTHDWNDDYKVRGLSTDTQTLVGAS